MEVIHFYDVSIGQKMATLSGETMDVVDLSRRKKLEDPVLFESKGLIEKLDKYDFDPIGIKHSSRWENIMATMIFSISDQIPNREEIKRGRQIIEKLPRHLKADIDRQFVLTFLPYLLTGFNFHLGKSFVANANLIDNSVSFIGEVYRNPLVNASSFLCAHRESFKVKTLSLVDHVHEKKVKRVLGLELGLLANALIKTINIDWYQQTATPKASSNMFPEIFINYLKTGKIGDLMKTIEAHRVEIEGLMSKYIGPDTNLNLKPLDTFTSLVESYLDNRYGETWREMQSFSNENDALAKIAYEMTLPEVTRLMPFFKQATEAIVELNRYKYSTVTTNHEEQNLIAAVIEWFLKCQKMTKFGKALYETAFYYLWGALSGNNSMVGIGIDRDHDNYQYYAFRQGYNDNRRDKTTQEDNIPLLYARRNEEEKPKGLLKDISFRQFWRGE
ncbi:MAG: hypothetical protein HYW86_04195 [Candidatus Roizmanbacteria bacterium]|nr:MAG: hypothetical protein HYW86_04195 [Candidatus Roizmanbacteria bacterium]